MSRGCRGFSATMQILERYGRLSWPGLPTGSGAYIISDKMARLPSCFTLKLSTHLWLERFRKSLNSSDVGGDHDEWPY